MNLDTILHSAFEIWIDRAEKAKQIIESKGRSLFHFQEYLKVYATKYTIDRCWKEKVENVWNKTTVNALIIEKMENYAQSLIFKP